MAFSVVKHEVNESINPGICIHGRQFVFFGVACIGWVLDVGGPGLPEPRVAGENAAGERT